MDSANLEMMNNKRNIADCESDTSYVVIETTDKNGGVFVQFIPCSWFKLLKPNLKIIVRAMAQFYFPRQLPGQTINQHSKFVKNAKFIGMPPQTNNNWELLNCRVLKIGIGKHAFQLRLYNVVAIYF